MKRLIFAVRSIHQREVGVSTIGAALLMMAIMAAGAGVSYSALAQGNDNAERVDQVVGEAIDNTTDLAFIGNVVYVDDDNADGVIDANDSITFSIAPAPGSAGIDPAGLLVSLRTDASRDAADFTVNELRGNGDNLIEDGELVELTIAPTANLAPGQQFTIELQYGDGPTSSSTRTLPQAIDGLMALY